MIVLLDPSSSPLSLFFSSWFFCCVLFWGCIDVLLCSKIVTVSSSKLRSSHRKKAIILFPELEVSLKDAFESSQAHEDQSHQFVSSSSFWKSKEYYKGTQKVSLPAVISIAQRWNTLCIGHEQRRGPRRSNRWIHFHYHWVVSDVTGRQGSPAVPWATQRRSQG